MILISKYKPYIIIGQLITYLVSKQFSVSDVNNTNTVAAHVSGEGEATHGLNIEKLILA